MDQLWIKTLASILNFKEHEENLSLNARQLKVKHPKKSSENFELLSDFLRLEH